MKSLISISSFLTLLCSCTTINKTIDYTNLSSASLTQCNEKLTEVVVQDLFNPPVASRIYAYPNIAAYETLINGYPSYRSFHGQLNDMIQMPAPDKTKQYDFSIAALFAFTEVAKKLIYTEYLFIDYEKYLTDSLQKITDDELLENSIKFGKQVADSIKKWAAKDMFKETRGMTRYSLIDSAWAWKPTPPDYLPALEPHWGKVRPFVIKSPDDFLVSPPPVSFSKDKNSEHFKFTKEVYDFVNNTNDELKDIAVFWDCNPNVSTHTGHLTIFNQKMTPGGHWISIALLASRMKNANMMQTAEAVSCTAITLADAFISCWNAKYKYNTIRPVTEITETFDHNWLPMLQTPPFPEYPSGHSTISAAAAIMLTHIYGDNFAFTDSSEAPFGLPIRSFTSFNQAADEVSISRVYGGIHYRFSCDAANKNGKEIASYIINNIKTKTQ
ncbi:MAG: vanadium-dependent haloperoxidase [Bacteroidia bacterium]